MLTIGEEGNSLTLGRNKNGEVGFFKYNGTLIPPYRAYLTRNNIIEGSTSLIIAIGDDIDTTDAVKSCELGVMSPSAIYDISGRKLLTTTLPGSYTPTLLKKGIYIVNGKKVVVR